MSQSRRTFLKQTGVLSAGLLALPSLGLAQSELSTLVGHKFGAFAIHQGLTLEDLTYLSVLRPANAQISFEVVDSQNHLQNFFIISANRMQGSEWQLDKIKVSDLKLGEKYRFRVLNASKQIIDERFFQALDTQKKNPKIAVASCMSDFFRRASTIMWAKLHSHNPDVVFLVGDTCYADQGNDGTPLGFWTRYAETRSRIGMFRHQTLTPILAAWDDHDFGKNNADSSFAHKDFMLKLFSTWWLHPEERSYSRGVGISQVFTAFGQKFYLMDGRYFRTATVYHGAEQEQSLFNSLNEYEQPSWLMNGSQFFGGYLKKEGYEYTHYPQFKKFCEQLALVKAPVCFVSGDVHFSELMQIEREILGYKTYEITSSSMHSFTFLQMHNRRKNPRRISKCGTSKHNFNIITIDNTSDKFKFHVSCQGDEKEIYFQKSVEIIR